VSRREALGLVVVAALVLLGRLLRRRLLLGPDGEWRDPAWLAAHLPPPPPPDSPPPRGPRRPAAPIDPNTCPADSLQLLPGVGPAIAGRIVRARAAGVHFARARDLQAVRGIGPRTAERIAPYLAFGTEDTTDSGALRSAR
jgi:competence protein ComEA